MSFGSGVRVGALFGGSNSSPRASNDANTPPTSSHSIRKLSGLPREGSRGGALQTFLAVLFCKTAGLGFRVVFWTSRAPPRRTRGRAARSDAARVGDRVDSGDRRDRRGGRVPLLRRRRDRGGTVHVIGPPGRQHHRRRQPPRGDTARCAHRRGVSDRGEQGHRSVEGVHRHRQGSIVQGRARRGGEVPATRAQGGAGGIRQGRSPRRRRS